jgi:hypothetical protein
MATDVTSLGSRLPAAMHPLVSPVILASQPAETARFVPMQYTTSAFYRTNGLQCAGPPRAISRLLTPADIAELGAHRMDGDPR